MALANSDDDVLYTGEPSYLQLIRTWEQIWPVAPSLNLAQIENSPHLSINSLQMLQAIASDGRYILRPGRPLL